MVIPIAGWVAPFGYPRIKACSRLPMAFRSVPRPSSPPGAKASTECPSRAHPPHMHRNQPQLAPCRPRANKTSSEPVQLRSIYTHASGRPRCSTQRRHAPPRVRPTRITARPETHQPLHLSKEHLDHRIPQPRTGACAPRAGPVEPDRKSPVMMPMPNRPANADRGGGGRDRTDDPLLAKQVLSQLSYAPTRLCPPGDHLQPSARRPVGGGGPGRT